MIKYFRERHKLLFLADATGALITSLLLLTVLSPFHDLFGLPKHLYNPLATIAICFSIYSFTCFAVNPKKWRLFLRIIAAANTMYCLLTIGLILYNVQAITFWGMAYFVGECIIVGILVFVEIKVVEK